MAHLCPDSTRCAEVGVGGQAVMLTFHGDLTPVEAVAVFLRDLADVADTVHGTVLLLDIADQLDEPDGAKAPVRDPALLLTEQQTVVLDLASRGLSSEEAAHQLFLSAHTVKSHLRRAYRALGARDRAHAVRLGLETGVLTLDTRTQS